MKNLLGHLPVTIPLNPLYLISRHSVLPGYCALTSCLSVFSPA